MSHAIYRYVTRREAAVAVLAGAAAFIVGLWAGVWAVPDAALSVPVDSWVRNGRTVYEAAYQPVPTWLPLGSVVIVAAAGWSAWRITHPPEETERNDSSPADVGGGRKVPRTVDEPRKDASGESSQRNDSSEAAADGGSFVCPTCESDVCDRFEEADREVADGE